MQLTLYSEITFDEGRVQQSNFNTYRMLRMALCVQLASLLDGTRAYGAVLSGYTVATVAVPDIDTPQDVFATRFDCAATNSTPRNRGSFNSLECVRSTATKRGGRLLISEEY